MAPATPEAPTCRSLRQKPLPTSSAGHPAAPPGSVPNAPAPATDAPAHRSTAVGATQITWGTTEAATARPHLAERQLGSERHRGCTQADRPCAGTAHREQQRGEEGGGRVIARAAEARQRPGQDAHHPCQVEVPGPHPGQREGPSRPQQAGGHRCQRRGPARGARWDHQPDEADHAGEAGGDARDEHHHDRGGPADQRRAQAHEGEQRYPLRQAGAQPVDPGRDLDRRRHLQVEAEHRLHGQPRADDDEGDEQAQAPRPPAGHRRVRGGGGRHVAHLRGAPSPGRSTGATLQFCGPRPAGTRPRGSTMRASTT
jgi:hypothetical protein